MTTFEDLAVDDAADRELRLTIPDIAVVPGGSTTAPHPPSARWMRGYTPGPQHPRRAQEVCSSFASSMRIRARCGNAAAVSPVMPEQSRFKLAMYNRSRVPGVRQPSRTTSSVSGPARLHAGGAPASAGGRCHPFGRRRRRGYAGSNGSTKVDSAGDRRAPSERVGLETSIADIAARLAELRCWRSFLLPSYLCTPEAGAGRASRVWPRRTTRARSRSRHAHLSRCLSQR